MVGISAQETERPAFSVWLEGVRADAIARGIKPDTVARAFEGLEPLEVVVERDRTQAETVLTVEQYVQRRLTPRFVRTARERARAERQILRKVGDRYGVQPRFLVAIWGLESNFGRFSGVRPVVQALATLAWEGRRGPFFTGELMNALEIVDRGHIDLAAMKGSWAGAMGQTQFMPTNFVDYAIDFSGDGKKDIWANVQDAMGSTGNYLKKYGWVPGLPWGFEVTVPANFDYRLSRGTFAEWTQRGVRRVEDHLGEVPLYLRGT